jgi:hypothetical protein
MAERSGGVAPLLLSVGSIIASLMCIVSIVTVVAMLFRAGNPVHGVPYVVAAIAFGALAVWLDRLKKRR